MLARPLPTLLAASAIAAVIAGGCTSAPEEVVKTDQSAATSERGYCRSTTCSAPKEYPTAGLCEPEDWPQHCASIERHDFPLFWRSGCIGYSLQKNSGKEVAYDTLAKAASAAFLAWTSRACPTGGAGPSRPSIDVRDLGPVACAEVYFSHTGPNQSVIVFRDDVWPHKEKEGVPLDQPSPTIALTTVSYDPNTGEILDADMELNSADHHIVPLDAPGDVPEGAYDLQAVLTHEAGHVFGIAHAPSSFSVMYAHDEGGEIRKRTIGLEDVAAICSIYPPNGKRTVAPEVDPSGVVAGTACDPTPRRGFTAECVHDDTHGCTTAPGSPPPGGAAAAFVAIAMLLTRRRRARGARGERSSPRN